MCRSRLWLLYWVSTQIFLIPLLARFDSAKSTSRYTPPNGTAGLARSSVSGASRVPAPPASTIPRTRGSAMCVPPEVIWCNAALQTQAWEDPARRVKIKFNHFERTVTPPHPSRSPPTPPAPGMLTPTG